MCRSALEKALKVNGYTKGSLQTKIDDAAADGVITAARKQRAHDDIRVLGNEVVHDEWRPVSAEEVKSALHYTQRVLEDFYDDRTAVEQVLKAKGRL
jgi:hypothetical protein